MSSNSPRVRSDVLEVVLLALALIFAIWTARTVQQNSDEGLQRWKADVANADLQLDRKRLPSLTASWCQRDVEAVREMLPKAHASVCESPHLLMRWWIPQPLLDRTDVRFEAVLAIWQKEMRNRSAQMRELMGQTESRRLTAELLIDISPKVGVGDGSAELSWQEEVSLEQQAADDALRRRSEALQRQEKWDKWVSAELDPLLKAPATAIDVSALWSAARSLDGHGIDAGSQMVRRHLSAASNAQKAKQLLKMHAGLELLLVFHALMTWLMFTLVRRAWTEVAQSLSLACLGMMFWVGLYALGGSTSPLQQPRAVASLAAGTVVLWLLQHFCKSAKAATEQKRSLSVLLLPGWWFFTAIGWLLLWDESLNFHPRLRFLALEHWTSWCVAAWLMPLAACHGDILLGLVRRFSAWWLTWLRPWHILGRVVVGAFLVACFAVLHRIGIGQYMTGELAKALVVITAAGWSLWKLPMVSELWQGRQARAVIPNLAWLAALMLVAALVAAVTADKGPFLVLGMVLVVLLSSGLGWTTGLAMLGLGILVMVLVGVDLEVVGGRLQAWKNPFTADHDDMARLVWFQAAASDSAWGFGPGKTPWCGTGQLDACHGLPLQLQSDYTYTAIKGWWGPVGSWLLVSAFSLWCFRLMTLAARESTRWTTPLALLPLHQASSALRAHLLFITSLLVLLQTWVTVSGNLGWLPLTGVTWPLVSFGKTSLWFTSGFLGAWGLRRAHA